MHSQVTRNSFLLLIFGALFTLLTGTATALELFGKGGDSSSLQSILSGDGEEIIPPEQAYILSTQVETPHLLRLKWEIAAGTYLYQERIRITKTEGDGISLGKYQLPPAEIKKDALRPDGTIGDLPIYHHELDLPLPLIRTNKAATSITLEIMYQGCADAGFCYPPQTKRITLDLPPADAATAIAPSAVSTTTDPVSELDSLVSILKGGNYWLISGIFFLAGLGLALTPCIFPMIPILSGIIVGQGNKITTAKAFSISLVYVLAMAIVYTIAGVLAGLFGANLQASFQNPWILGSFAGIFVLLALSMFGFFELRLPSSLQSRLTEISNKQQGGTMIGAAIMGALSALIVGPCVAPALAAAILVIGQSGDPILGGTALFALSIGMGVPILALGTSVGKLLPKAGGWMNAVKRVFGVALLAVAILMLERVIPSAVSMILWGTLLVISGIYMGALLRLTTTASGWQKLWKGLGVILLLYGAFILLGAAAGGSDPLQPLRGSSLLQGAAPQPQLPFRLIKSEADLDREIAAASTQNRPVMLDFSADWCTVCKEMERYTFSDPKVIKALEGFVLLRADVTANDATDKALLQGRFGMPGPPSIMFFDRSGKELKNLRVVGFMPADKFSAYVERAAK